MKIDRKTKLAIALALVLLTVLACGPGGERVTPTPTTAPLPTEETQVAEVTPGGGEVTVTPAPPVTTEAGCTLNGAFADDVTIPDNTQLAPNTAFVKTWRLRNSGTCAWEAGTLLVYVSGDAMGGPASVPVAAVAPGSTTDVSVNLTAPATPGTYRGNWQLQAPDGTRFGSVVYVQIVVPATPTPTTTPAPVTLTPTPVPITLTPTPVAGCVAVDPDLALIVTQAQTLGYDLGCPTQPAFTIFGAFQEFWANVDNPNPHTHFRSLMIWRSDNREIYVIDGVDTNASEGLLLAYTDFWDESQPEIPPACAAMTVPSGYQLPRRGFGRIWCTNSLWDPIGWPNMAEEAVSLRIQPTQTGLLIKVIRPSAGGYLIALDYRAVYAITRMVGP